MGFHVAFNFMNMYRKVYLREKETESEREGGSRGRERKEGRKEGRQRGREEGKRNSVLSRAVEMETYSESSSCTWDLDEMRSYLGALFPESLCWFSFRVLLL